MVKGVPSGGGGVGVGVSPNLLKYVGILTKCVGKIWRPYVVGKFGVFYHKKKTKWRILSISSPIETKLLPAMTAFVPTIMIIMNI